MDDIQIKYFVEAALLASGRPLSVDQLQKLFDGRMTPEKAQIRQAINGLQEDYEDRGITITEVASGFRIQIDSLMVERLQKLWEERPPRYSRALFETLALIAYRQPITRGEIEEIRGVAVSSNIIRTLLEREWVRVLGHRDVPGRPEMFGTTRQFLDYFSLKKLEDLPPLADLSDWESLRVQLNLPAVEEDEAGTPAETADVTQIPMIEPEGEGEESEHQSDAEIEAPAANDEAAQADESLDVPGDDGFEPIEVTEWPEPDAGDVVVAVIEEGADTVVQSLDDEDADEEDDEAESRKDADASLTGA